MLGTRWQLFRLMGIPIGVDLSWLIILALLTWTLAGVFPGLMQEEYPGAAAALSRADYLLMGLITALMFFVCIVLHELGHALVARATGLPIRGITLFLFGGVAELEGEPASAGKEFVMAIAGPVVSLVLAGLFFVLSQAAAWADGGPALVIVLQYLAVINAVVLLFNLVPAFPLDGGRVLRSALWAGTGNLRRATYWASLCGQGFAWTLIAWGIYQFFNGDISRGIWSGLIGMFLNNAAQSSYQQVVVKQALQHVPVRRIMNPSPVVVPPWIDLRQWVEDYVYRYHRKAFPVAVDGRLQGYVTTQVLSEYPREEWDRHTVADVMVRDLDDVTIDPETDAVEALSRMQETSSSRLLVTEGDRLVGLISLKDLLRFLSLKLELEGMDEELPAGPKPKDEILMTKDKRMTKPE